MSGTANVNWAITDDPLQQTRQLAALCNISNAGELSSTALATALRQIDAVILFNAADGLKYWHVDPLTNFRPVVENASVPNAFLTAHPIEVLETGKYQAVPWLLGHVPNEGAVRVTQIYENTTLRSSFNARFDELIRLVNDMPKVFSLAQMLEKTSAIIQEYFGKQHELNNETIQGFMDVSRI